MSVKEGVEGYALKRAVLKWRKRAEVTNWIRGRFNKFVKKWR